MSTIRKQLAALRNEVERIAEPDGDDMPGIAIIMPSADLPPGSTLWLGPGDKPALTDTGVTFVLEGIEGGEEYDP